VGSAQALGDELSDGALALGAALCDAPPSYP
jgi:hypothetical protein